MAYRLSKRVEEWKDFKMTVKSTKHYFLTIKFKRLHQKSKTMRPNKLGQETKTASH